MAFGFAVGARALFLRELRVGFFFAGLLRDGAGGGDPVVLVGVGAEGPVVEDFGEGAWEGWGRGFGEGCVIFEVR